MTTTLEKNKQNDWSKFFVHWHRRKCPCVGAVRKDGPRPCFQAWFADYDEYPKVPNIGEKIRIRDRNSPYDRDEPPYKTYKATFMGMVDTSTQ